MTTVLLNQQASLAVSFFAELNRWRILLVCPDARQCYAVGCQFRCQLRGRSTGRFRREIYASWSTIVHLDPALWEEFHILAIKGNTSSWALLGEIVTKCLDDADAMKNSNRFIRCCTRPKATIVAPMERTPFHNPQLPLTEPEIVEVTFLTGTAIEMDEDRQVVSAVGWCDCPGAGERRIKVRVCMSRSAAEAHCRRLMKVLGIRAQGH